MRKLETLVDVGELVKYIDKNPELGLALLCTFNKSKSKYFDDKLCVAFYNGVEKEFEVLTYYTWKNPNPGMTSEYYNKSQFLSKFTIIGIVPDFLQVGDPYMVEDEGDEY